MEDAATTLPTWPAPPACVPRIRASPKHRGWLGWGQGQGRPEWRPCRHVDRPAYPLAPAARTLRIAPAASGSGFSRMPAAAAIWL